MILNKVYLDFFLVFNKIGSIKVITPLVFLTLLLMFSLIPINIGRLGVRIDDILILLCIPIMLFLFSLIVSILYGYLVIYVPFNSGDINEFIRYYKILLFALLLEYISVTKLSDITFKIFYYSSFYIIVVGYLQYFDPFRIGKYLSLLYTFESQIYTVLEYEVRRITVTGIRPNDGAIIVAYFILFRILFFTQSRTVLISTVFLLAFIFFILNGYWTQKIFLLIVISSGIVVLFLLFSYVFIFIQLFFEAENNSILVNSENEQIEKISNNNLKIYYFILLASCIMGSAVVLTNNFITTYQSFLPLILLMVLSVRLFNKAEKCTY